MCVCGGGCNYIHLLHVHGGHRNSLVSVIIPIQHNKIRLHFYRMYMYMYKVCIYHYVHIYMYIPLLWLNFVCYSTVSERYQIL